MQLITIPTHPYTTHTFPAHHDNNIKFLSYTTLSGSTLHGSTLHGSIFHSSTLCGSFLHSFTLLNSTLRGSSLHSFTLLNSTLRGSSLHSSTKHVSTLHSSTSRGPSLLCKYTPTVSNNLPPSHARSAFFCRRCPIRPGNVVCCSAVCIPKLHRGYFVRLSRTTRCSSQADEIPSV